MLGTGSSYGLGSTGGNSTVTLSVANLPSHNHTASTANHSHSQPAHKHSIYAWYSAGGATHHSRAGGFAYGVDAGASQKTEANACLEAGGDTTGSASPTTSIGYTGSGSAFSIMPPYLVVNIWKRLS